MLQNTGSISRAAGRLFLSQPSVSLQIQALERESGTKLLFSGNDETSTLRADPGAARSAIAPRANT